MKTVHKSVLIWYSPAEMYKLVTDVDTYAQFLPWCDQARVISTTDTGMVAEIGIALGGVKQRFTTHNTHVTNETIHMKLISGPFSNLEGRWLFKPVGDGSQRACKVELDLQYGFDNVLLAKLVGPVFDKIASSLVDAFVQRAQKIYA